MNVYDLFVQLLGSAPSDQTLRELPVDSACGQDCASAISAGKLLLDHAYAAAGRDSAASRQVISAVEEIVLVYYRG